MKTFAEVTYLIRWGENGGVTVYGFMIAVGILLGALFGFMLSKRRSYPRDMVIDMGLWGVPLAVVGARLYYIIFTAIGDGRPWTFGEMFAFKDGGLAVYGAVLFAILGAFLLSIVYKKRVKPDPAEVNAKIEGLELKIAGVQAEIDGLAAEENKTPEIEQKTAALNAKKKKLIKEKETLLDSLKPKPTFFQMADLGAPFLILGQALGRIGCYFSECCYGNAVNNPALQKFPFAVLISETGRWHLATYLYECVWCLLGFALMIYFSFRKKKPRDSFVFSFYLMFYGAGRFVLEFLRKGGDSSETLWLVKNVLPVSMMVAVIMFAWGAYIMIRAFFFKKNTQAP